MMEKEIGQKEVGVVTHYYGHLQVAVVDLTHDLQVGHKVRFVGNQTDVIQVIVSMQIEHDFIESAKAGQSVAIKVDQPVRERDRAYLISVPETP